jgi:hypothetical protein
VLIIPFIPPNKALLGWRLLQIKYKREMTQEAFYPTGVFDYL